MSKTKERRSLNINVFQSRKCIPFAINNIKKKLYYWYCIVYVKYWLPHSDISEKGNLLSQLEADTTFGSRYSIFIVLESEYIENNISEWKAVIGEGPSM